MPPVRRPRWLDLHSWIDRLVRLAAASRASRRSGHADESDRSPSGVGRRRSCAASSSGCSRRSPVWRVAEVVTGLSRGAVVAGPAGRAEGDRRHVPLGVKNWAIETFGTSDKAVLVVGTLFSLFVIGIDRRDPRRQGHVIVAAYIGTGVVGLIGVWAVLARPAPTFAKLLPPIVGTLASIAVLWYLTPGARSRQHGRVAGSTATPTDDQAGSPTPLRAGGGDGRHRSPRWRRSSAGCSSVRFDVDEERADLQLPAPSDTAAPVATVPPSERARRAGGRRGDRRLPPGRRLRHRRRDAVRQPNDDFYRIDTALAVPQVPKDSWSLHIHGMVDQRDHADVRRPPGRGR